MSISTIINTEFARDFLKHFGYLPIENPTEDQIQDAVKVFQEDNGIIPNGDIGPKTAGRMLVPRCGVTEDKMVQSASNLWHWDRKVGEYYQVDYFIHPGLSEMLHMEQGLFDKIIKRCFETDWCKHSNLNLTRVSSEKEKYCINVYGNRLDGPSSILAQCELPVDGVRSCKMELDISERWVYEVAPSTMGIVLANVVNHELGHGLGLVHSRVKAALMAPSYSSSVQLPNMTDDIPRLQARYDGSRIKPIPTETPNPNDGNIHIEEITVKINGKVYGFDTE